MESLLFELRKNAEIIQGLIKKTEALSVKETQEDCTICYDSDNKQEKACVKCKQKTCKSCYSKLGNCPFCKDKKFGGLTNTQVTTSYNQQYFEDFEEDEESGEEEYLTDNQRRLRHEAEIRAFRLRQQREVRDIQRARFLARQQGQVLTVTSGFFCNGNKYSYIINGTNFLVSETERSVVVNVDNKRFIVKKDITERTERKIGNSHGYITLSFEPNMKITVRKRGVELFTIIDIKEKEMIRYNLMIV